MSKQRASAASQERIRNPFEMIKWLRDSYRVRLLMSCHSRGSALEFAISLTISKTSTKIVLCMTLDDHAGNCLRILTLSTLGRTQLPFVHFITRHGFYDVQAETLVGILTTQISGLMKCSRFTTNPFSVPVVISCDYGTTQPGSHHGNDLRSG